MILIYNAHKDNGTAAQIQIQLARPPVLYGYEQLACAYTVAEASGYCGYVGTLASVVLADLYTISKIGGCNVLYRRSDRSRFWQ